jgi:hypothetical protein
MPKISCLDIASSGEFECLVEEQIDAYTRLGDKWLPHDSIPLKTILIDESTVEGMLQILDNIMVKQLGNETPGSIANCSLSMAIKRLSIG